MMNVTMVMEVPRMAHQIMTMSGPPWMIVWMIDSCFGAAGAPASWASAESQEEEGERRKILFFIGKVEGE